MPTFVDPRADALEASDALRGLVHASRAFDHPQDMYGVLSDLLSTVRSLRQVFAQLADGHTENRPRAFDRAGDHEAESRDALTAAGELREAGTLLDRVEDHLAAALTSAREISWHATPARTQRQWVSVVFLQGPEAEEALDLIQDEGPSAGIEYLAQWDAGDETTSAALINGHVYNEPPSGSLERTVSEGEYTLTYSPFLGQVSLLRAHNIPVEPPEEPELSAGRTPTTATSQTTGRNWFAETPGSAKSPSRGLGL